MRDVVVALRRPPGAGGVELHRRRRQQGGLGRHAVAGRGRARGPLIPVGDRVGRAGAGDLCRSDLHGAPRVPDVVDQHGAGGEAGDLHLGRGGHVDAFDGDAIALGVGQRRVAQLHPIRIDQVARHPRQLAPRRLEHDLVGHAVQVARRRGGRAGVARLAVPLESGHRVAVQAYGDRLVGVGGLRPAAVEQPLDLHSARGQGIIQGQRCRHA